MAARLTARFAKSHPGGPRIEAALDLPLECGGITVLFGASGSGKTTVLRCLAGLETPDEGRIEAGEDLWSDSASRRFMPAHHRRVGLVFQEDALFPHLSVSGNLAFGLKGLSSQQRLARVAEMIELVGLEGLEHRRPAELSGGQRQRAALARALAPRPRLLLLDEPFASLDQPAQIQLRRSLRDLLRSLQVPAVLVTHDREEALALGDQMVVLHGGRTVQHGTPAEVFSRPATPELAMLVGMGTVVPVRIKDRAQGLLTLEAGIACLSAPDPGGLENGRGGGRLFACIRAEDVALERHPSATTARNTLPGRILALESTPPLVRVQLDCGFPLEALITASSLADLDLKVGDGIHAVVKAAAIHLVVG